MTKEEILNKHLNGALYPKAYEQVYAAMEQYANQKPSHPAQGEQIGVVVDKTNATKSWKDEVPQGEITVKDFEDAIESNMNGAMGAYPIVIGVDKAAKACYALAQKLHSTPANSSGNLAAGVDWLKRVRRTVGLMEASLNGSLDGLELDNVADVVEKHFVIEMVKELTGFVNELKSLTDKKENR